MSETRTTGVDFTDRHHKYYIDSADLHVVVRCCLERPQNVECERTLMSGLFALPFPGPEDALPRPWVFLLSGILCF